jgi:hypothetical protein
MSGIPRQLQFLFDVGLSATFFPKESGTKSFSIDFFSKESGTKILSISIDLKSSSHTKRIGNDRSAQK